MQHDNSLAGTCPISEADMLENAKKYFQTELQDIQQATNEFIEAIRPNIPNHKIVVNVVHLDNPSGAFCISGAHWDPKQDGTWVTGLGNNLITVSWIKA